MQVLPRQVLFATCDDMPQRVDVLTLKLQEAKSALAEQVAKLKIVQEPIQWKSATDYAIITTQLIDIEAKIHGVFARLCLSGGIEKHIPLQNSPQAVLQLMQEEKKLELELGLSLKSLKKLKKLCESQSRREPKGSTLASPGALEQDLSRFSGQNYSYGFWKSVPYLIQASYSAPSVLGGGYYQASGKLGSDLEKQVGQKLGALVAKLLARIAEFCSWRPDDDIAQEINTYTACVDWLYKGFIELYETVSTIEQDALIKYVHDYAYGLEYAFREARSLLKLMQRFSVEPAACVLEAVHDLEATYCRPELEDAKKLYKPLEKIAQKEALKLQLNGKNFFDAFLCRLLDMVHDVHANLDPAFLALNQHEALVFERLLTAPSNDASVMSYLAKRMLSALFFPMKHELDIELELALHICGDIESLQSIREAYEGVYSQRRLARSDEYSRAVVLARRILYMQTKAMPLLHYADCWQRCVEFCEALGHKKAEAFMPVLSLPLERIAKQHGFTLLEEGSFAYSMMSSISAALFAGTSKAKLAGYSFIAEMMEDARYENDLLGLQSDLCQLLYTTSIHKLLALPYDSPASLGMREMRHFIEHLALGIESIEVQMALYKLIRKERERGGFKHISEYLITQTSEAQFTRWYASFDDLYRKSVCTPKIQYAKPLVASDDAVRALATMRHAADEPDIWIDVVAKRTTSEQAAKLQDYLHTHITGVLAAHALDVSLELLLYCLKSSKADPQLMVACKANKPLFERMSQYERVFRHNRSDILLKEALDLLQPVLPMLHGHFDVFTYACSWQKCIEFARKADVDVSSKEQHTKIAALLYATLDRISQKQAVIGLEGTHRYCSLANPQIHSGTTQSLLLRLLACCLYGSDPLEQQQAQVHVTSLLEMQNVTNLLSENIRSLVFENTMDKIIKGSFDVGKCEKSLFIAGPLADCIRKDRVSLSDSKLQHAMFFLICKERLRPDCGQPVLDMFLQNKGQDVFEAWYRHYLQFLASGPVADSANAIMCSLDREALHTEIAFSKHLRLAAI